MRQVQQVTWVERQLNPVTQSPWALALPVLAMLSLVAGTFVERRASSRPPLMVAMAIYATATFLASGLLAALTGALVPPPSTGFWVAAVTSAVLPSFAGYALYWWLLRRIGVTALNALLFLVAPTTAVAGALLLGEPLTALTVAGFALCGTGVGVVLSVEARRNAPTTVGDPVPSSSVGASCRTG